MIVTLTEWKNWSTAQSLPDASRGYTKQTAKTSAATSSAFAAMQTDTVAVTVATDTAIHFEYGASPTATTDSPLLPAGTSFSFARNPDDGKTVAILTAV